MLDIKLFRESPQLIKDNLEKREGFDLNLVEQVIKNDNLFREFKSKVDSLKSEKNKNNRNISKVKREGGNIKPLVEKVKLLNIDLQKAEEELKRSELDRDKSLVAIPNLLDSQVPKGTDDDENLEIRLSGKKPKFSFKVKSHQELCELNDWFDLERASKYAGARFYYLKNELVMLEMYLYTFVFEKLVKKGYTPMEVPPILRKDAIGKSVSLEDFEEVIYKIESGDENNEQCLIATSEPALAIYHDNQTFQVKDLPKKYAGISPCFRKEAGVTKDEKGIFRVHNFNKIEQFIFCRKEDSDKFLEELIKNAEEIFKELEIHFRIVDICSGDIGSFAARKYDLEAYLPEQDKYREMVSASNYRDYGARRLNCKYQDEKNQLNFVNTLNSTAIALTRTLVAILETHQTEDGNVRIPKVLQKYFGREFLKEK